MAFNMLVENLLLYIKTLLSCQTCSRSVFVKFLCESVSDVAETANMVSNNPSLIGLATRCLLDTTYDVFV